MAKKPEARGASPAGGRPGQPRPPTPGPTVNKLVVRKVNKMTRRGGECHSSEGVQSKDRARSRRAAKEEDICVEGRKRS